VVVLGLAIAFDATIKNNDNMIWVVTVFILISLIYNFFWKKYITLCLEMFANLVERQLKIINGVYQLTTGDQKNQQIIFFSGMKWPGK
jgi:F0F1-type ATP synthase membrane subunit b/b'